MTTFLHRVTLLVALLPALAFGQGSPNPVPQFSTLGRTLVRQTTQAGMQNVIGVTALTGAAVTNNDTRDLVFWGDLTLEAATVLSAPAFVGGAFSGDGSALTGITTGATNLTHSIYFDHGGVKYYFSNNVMRINVADFIPENASAAQTRAGIQMAMDMTTNSTCPGCDGNANAPYWTNSHSEVFFPNGTYYVDAPLFPRVHGTKFVGEGRWGRARIMQQAATNLFVFDGSGWVGWNSGGANRMWGLEFESLEMATSVTGASQRFAAVRFMNTGSGVHGTQSASRSVFRNCNFTGWFYGAYLNHAVNTRFEMCDFQANAFALFLRGADSVTAENCFFAKGYDGSGFAYTDPIANVWIETGGGTDYGTKVGFNVNLIGCEAGDNKRVLYVNDSSVSVNIIGLNAELDNHASYGSDFGPAFDIEAVGSLNMTGVRVGSINSYPAHTQPIVRLAAGMGARTVIQGGSEFGNTGVWPSGAAKIKLEGAGDYVTVIGTLPMVVTNSVDGVAWIAPLNTNRVVVAAGSGATVAQSQAGPVTTYTVATSEPATNRIWVGAADVTAFRNSTYITPTESGMLDQFTVWRDSAGIRGIHCYDTTGNFKFFTSVNPRGKLICDITQWFMTTNTSHVPVAARVAIHNFTNTIATGYLGSESIAATLNPNAGTNTWTHTYTITAPATATNAIWDFQLGRNNNTPTPTNTVFWLGAMLEFR